MVWFAESSQIVSTLRTKTQIKKQDTVIPPLP